MPSTSKMFVMALAAILAGVLPGLVGAGPVGLAGWINVVVLGAGALQVFNAPNISGWNYAKTVAAVIAAVGVVVISALSDFAVSPAEWVQIILAGLGAAGVYAAPNGGAARTEPSA